MLTSVSLSRQDVILGRALLAWGLVDQQRLVECANEVQRLLQQGYPATLGQQLVQQRARRVVDQALDLLARLPPQPGANRLPRPRQAQTRIVGARYRPGLQLAQLPRRRLATDLAVDRGQPRIPAALEALAHEFLGDGVVAVAAQAAHVGDDDLGIGAQALGQRRPARLQRLAREVGAREQRDGGLAFESVQGVVAEHAIAPECRDQLEQARMVVAGLGQAQAQAEERLAALRARITAIDGVP